jgi:hypothetical protein
VRAIRHDLPILLADPLLGERNLKIDVVVTDGQNGIATFHTPDKRGLVALRLKSGRWWWRAAAATRSDSGGAWTGLLFPGDDLGECGFMSSRAPTARELSQKGLIDERLAFQLSKRLAVAKQPHSGLGILCDSFGTSAESQSGGYHAWFADPSNYFGPSPSLIGHLPPLTSDEESRVDYYGFDLLASSPKPMILGAHTTIAVWFPFVLESDCYVLRLIGPSGTTRILGTLKQNVLHFDLPPLTLQSGEHLRGEIYLEPGCS